MNNSPRRPSILGIWRLGAPLYCTRSVELVLAQPADATGNPQWDYVIKRSLNDEDIESGQQIRRFAAAAAEASHPNLIAVLDASTTSASPYLVMPRLDGETLGWHLANTTRPLPVALWLVRQIAQALEALHASGWVHGDVKPENCLVGPRGHLTLLDLGFATPVQTAAAGYYRGTPEYSAPETLLENIASLPSRDIFSLGRILYRSLGRIEPVTQTILEPVLELVESMTSQQASQRPTAAQVAKRLLRLEIETLGQHIGPVPTPRAA